MEDAKQQHVLESALSNIIRPLLNVVLDKERTAGQVVTADHLSSIVKQMLDPPDAVSATHSEGLRVELLQLATLLIRKCTLGLTAFRKELIKFGWNHLKREDTLPKNEAFVNVAHFLAAYQAPEKIILQVFVALLRTCAAENRAYVRQALNVLTPALPKRLPQAREGKHPQQHRPPLMSTSHALRSAGLVVASRHGMLRLTASLSFDSPSHARPCRASTSSPSGSGTRRRSWWRRATACRTSRTFCT